MLNIKCNFIFLCIYFSVYHSFYSIATDGAGLKEENIDEVSSDILSTISSNEVNSLLPTIFSQFPQNNVEKPRHSFYTPSAVQEQVASKKSLIEIEKPTTFHGGNPTADSLALAEPNVYLRNRNIFVETPRPQDYTSVKRFSIPERSENLNAFTQKSLYFPVMSEGVSKSSADYVTNQQFSPWAFVKQSRRRDVLATERERRMKRHEVDERKPMPGDHTTTDYERQPLSTDVLTTDSKSRTKRQEDEEDDMDDEDNDEDELDSFTQDHYPRRDPVRQYTLALPTDDVTGQARSDVNGITRSSVGGSNVVAMVPVNVESPAVMSTLPSVALTTTGTERSVLPVSSLVQPSQNEQLVETTPVVRQQSFITTTQPASTVIPQRRQLAVRLVSQLEREIPAIKLAHVPVRDQTSAVLTRVLEREQTPVIKLGGFPVREENPTLKSVHVPVEVVDRENSEKRKADEIDETTLASLQLKLTNIISKLEDKVNEKKGKSKKVVDKELQKSKVNEKSLTFLKKKLNRVIAKFQSKPGSKQPFTVGKEWTHLLDDNLVKGKHTKNATSLEKSQEPSLKMNDGWPAIASQLLGKLNKALGKLQERKVAKFLEKDAVMYFNFDNHDATTRKSTQNNGDIIVDQSGHFNDATLSNRAHVSSRAYGSCGKALILNSGNLRYMEKYFRDKPAEAITLAMWVRTNATGFVRWFARDVDTSREFSTSTQYPLVRKNVWTHLCGTFNSSTGVTRIYVDGALKAEKVSMKRDVTVPADFTPAGIGSDFGDDNLIAVDEVYMFSRALGEKEVQAIYDSCDFNRMVLHYGFQKINRTAGVVFDQSGLNNNAILKGEALIKDGGCDKCGSCLDLNSKSGNEPRLIIAGNTFKRRPTKVISLAAWVNLNSTAGTHPLVDVSDAIMKQKSLLNLNVADGKLRWSASDKNQNPIFDLSTEQTVVPEGVWVHVLATYNSFSGKAKTFVDGHEKAVEETVKKIPIGEDWGEIKVGGKGAGATTDLGGYLDELAVYNWELDTQEVSYIMKYCPDHPKLVSFTVHVPLD